MMEFVKAMLWAMAPLALLLPVAVAIEYASPHTRYALRDRLPGALYIVFVPALVTGLSWPLHRLWDQLGVPSVANIAAWPLLARFAVLLLLFDFLRYWEHRFEHRFWWPVHSVHHSPHELHAANAYSHPLLAVPELAIVALPFSLIETGNPYAQVAVWTFVAFQDLVIHSPLRIHAGRWRTLYIDSRYHRIHHSVEPRHWHHNFGFVFPFWDLLFGTAYPVDGTEWPETGVPGMAPPIAPRDFLAHPFREWVRRARLGRTRPRGDEPELQSFIASV
ncbi:MAG: sterol desaturase family protein [Sphingomicrobium sp.]|nr:sterol desaturase family protein [Sphingomonadales bacterium]